MAGSVNKVILVGTIGKHGCTLTYAPSGTACARFMLVCTEQSQDGKYFSVLVPCQVWGRKAQQISTEVQPGQLCLFEGKVSRIKKDETWELVISGFDLTTIVQPAEVPHG